MSGSFAWVCICKQESRFVPDADPGTTGLALDFQAFLAPAAVLPRTDFHQLAAGLLALSPLCGGAHGLVTDKTKSFVLNGLNLNLNRHLLLTQAPPTLCPLCLTYFGPTSWGPDQWSGRTGSQLQMNRLSLRNNRLKLKASGELPITLEEFMEYTSN